MSSARKSAGFLDKREVPENLWIKCPETGEMVFHRDLEANQFVFPSSGYHMRMNARAAAASSSSTRGDGRRSRSPDVPLDPLKFRDERRYTERLKRRARQDRARGCGAPRRRRRRGRAARRRGAGFRLHGRLARHGRGRGDHHRRSMRPRERQQPFVVFAGSGGARMQEGVLSLMQLPRTTVAVEAS